MIAGEPLMKLKLIAAISALATISALAHAQQGGTPPSVPKPTKAVRRLPEVRGRQPERCL
jgi:hypothetical protein